MIISQSVTLLIHKDYYLMLLDPLSDIDTPGRLPV